MSDFPGPPWNRSLFRTLLSTVRWIHVPNQVQIHIPHPQFWNAKSYEKGKVSLNWWKNLTGTDMKVIYSLHWFHPGFWVMFHYRHFNMFDNTLSEMPLGVLSNMQFMYRIIFPTCKEFCIPKPVWLCWVQIQDCAHVLNLLYSLIRMISKLFTKIAVESKSKVFLQALMWGRKI